MKTLTTILLLITLAFVSCEKEESKEESTTVALQTGITYPDSIFYGNNILSFPDSTILSSGNHYEMGTVLEKDASLYIIITNYSDTTNTEPTWFQGGVLGWAVIGNFLSYPNTQKFIAAQTGKIDLQISFLAYGQTGNCTIDFYENGNTITRTKHLSWQ